MDKITDNLFKDISLVIKDKGYIINSINFSKAQGKSSKCELLVTISRIDNIPVSIIDCSIVSKAIAILIDVKNLISEAYNLVVSSKGCDDSLFFFNDFVKNTGRLVKVDLKSSNNKGSQFIGLIAKTVNGKIFFKRYCETKNINIIVSVSINDIKSAILIKDTIKGEFNERATRIR